MKVFVFSAHPFDQPFLQAAAAQHELFFSEKKLTSETAHYADGCDAVALFTADDASAPVLAKLRAHGVKYVALRSAGFDHADLRKAEELGMAVANVPEYSPYSVAEHAVAMVLALNRKLIEAHKLIELDDFRLDTLTGFDIHGKTIGVIGTGKIGAAFARIMKSFGTTVLAFDPVENNEILTLGVRYVGFNDVLQHADIVSLHCPLNEGTRYMISKPQLDRMKRSAILVNTSRGGLVNTADLLDALEAGRLGGACLDVYEREKGIFFEDYRQRIIVDPWFARLRNLKNVLITGHQAFLTREALRGIAETTIENISAWAVGAAAPNELTRALANAATR